MAQEAIRRLVRRTCGAGRLGSGQTPVCLPAILEIIVQIIGPQSKLERRLLPFISIL
jgi:hypothetical protein